MPEMKDNVATQPVRRRLPDERKAIVHHFNVGGYEGYLTVGFYEDGTVGEIFITTAKEGSTVSGLMDCFATAVSLALQYGVSAQSAVRQVQPHAIRAERVERESRDRVRQIVDGLHLPAGWPSSFSHVRLLPQRAPELRPRLRRPPTYQETDWGMGRRTHQHVKNAEP